MGRIILSLVIGILIGAVAVRWFSNEPRPEVSTSAVLPAGAETSKETRGVVLPEPERVVASPVRESITSEPDVLITAALRRYAEEGMRSGWKGVRSDEIPPEDLAEGMKSFEKTVLESPFGIGRSLGERQTKVEAALADAKSGGVFALLEKLEGAGPLPGLVRDPAQFEPLFQRVAGEEVRSGLLDREHPDKSIEDGVTLTWPAGVFRVGYLTREKHPFPRDVTIAGAGMDATMLVLHGDPSPGSGLRNFTIRDCTVNTNNNYLFDIRSNPSAVRFERARFVGFDMGAGGSCLLGTEGLALSAKFCRFEGGYGNSPQSGTLFCCQGLLARFDSCSLSLLNVEIGGLRPSATALFVGCRFDEILDDPVTEAIHKSGVIFENCTIARHEGGWETVPKLDLNALFPDWKKRME